MPLHNIFLQPRNAILIAKISSRLDGHLMKRCAYCDMDLGLGDTYPVIEFVKHLSDKHPDKVDERDIKTYNKLIKKLTG